MYYQEQIQDGVLCWRGTPNGDWIPFTAKELTEKLIEVQLLTRLAML